MPISYVQLTLEEYDRLKEVQKEATTIVEQTNINLKTSLDIANKKIEELEADLRKYAIGGARMKPELELDLEQEMPGEPILYDPEDILTDEVKEEILKQHRGKAKLGRRRWTSYEVAYMKTHATNHITLTEVALALGRTVASIKTQAARMGLDSSNDTLSEK